MNELPKRKSPRLKNFNYSTPGIYFITICTKDKQHLLSNISVGEGFHPLPQNKLTSIRKEIEKTLNYINETYKDISIDKYVIMPNHIHILIDTTGGDGTPPLQNIIGHLKSYTTKKYNKILWQRSYHDHIIRNEKDYKNI